MIVELRNTLTRRIDFARPAAGSIPRSRTTISRVTLVLQSVASGGMEAHCLSLAGELVHRAIAVQVVLPADREFDALANGFTCAGAAVVRLNTDRRKGAAAQTFALARLVTVICRFRPHAIHLHTGGATGGLAVLAIGRIFTSATIVHTEHDIPAIRSSRRARLTRRVADRFLHALVAVSRRNAGLRRKRTGAFASHFATVLNGVPVPATSASDRAAVRFRIRRSLGIPPLAILLGCIVRLADGKGLDTLLRAFASVHEAAPSTRLVLVGDGPLAAQLRALSAELGVQAAVHFAGYQKDPAPYIDALDAFVLPVPAGSMSIALLEAMVRGVPPIITFCGPEEAVIPGRTGLCAPPNDPTALADAMLMLVRSEKLRASLGRNAQAHVVRHFSTARVADDLIDIYAGARCRALPLRLGSAGPATPYPGRHPCSE